MLEKTLNRTVRLGEDSIDAEQELALMLCDTLRAAVKISRVSLNKGKSHM